MFIGIYAVCLKICIKKNQQIYIYFQNRFIVLPFECTEKEKKKLCFQPSSKNRNLTVNREDFYAEPRVHNLNTRLTYTLYC